MSIEQKPTIFSGIQPSGVMTLGNYIGAIRNWTTLQEQYQCIYSVVDLHAITVRQVPADLRRHTLEAVALLMACGLDPEKNILFVQSHVREHSELCWLLSCYTYMGELSRMTQFKEKSQKHAENINAGLFTYPVLMAADILLYQTDLVPVGEDQRQHLELSRDIAQRFNNEYSPTFKVPEGYIPKVGARIMSLQNPDKKMSKSDEDENAFISLLDTPEVIRRKLKRAVTDSESEVIYREDKKGIANLMSIYSTLSGQSYENIEKQFAGLGYGAFKEGVAEEIIKVLSPLQQRYQAFMADKTALKNILKGNAEKAAYIARRTLAKVKQKIGLVLPE